MPRPSPTRPRAILLPAAVLAALLLPCAAGAQEAGPAPTLAELQARTEAAPADGPAWYALGRALQSAGRHEQALDAFDRSVAVGHWIGAALLRSAQSAQALGRDDEAMERVERAAATPALFIGALEAMGPLPGLDDKPRFLAAKQQALASRFPCRAAGSYRQFDFWLGSWDVSLGGGPAVGRSTITSDLAGCVVREHWKTPVEEGTSVNFYDPATRLWHQVWTADGGTVTHYQGSFRDGAMRLEAQGFGDADGISTLRRLTFTPNADGSVRQHFEQSTDGGATWATTFDGHYTRVPD